MHCLGKVALKGEQKPRRGWGCLSENSLVLTKEFYVDWIKMTFQGGGNWLKLHLGKELSLGLLTWVLKLSGTILGLWFSFEQLPPFDQTLSLTERCDKHFWS